MAGVNTLTFEQASTLLNALRKQMTGASALAMADERDFVTVAQAALATGVDPVMSAISQLVGKTLFSIRPYKAKLGGIQVDEQRWGYITRKLAVADQDFVDDSGYSLTDGYSIDMYEVKKPNILQLNYYGQVIYQRFYTVFRDQLNSAFTGSQQFGEFMTMVTQNCLDIIEQNREVTRRLTLNNFIAGKIAATNGVIHALTEYNTATSQSLTNVTVFKKENFDDFCKWLYARMATISEMMTERSDLYQINVTGKVITRHSPKADQRSFIYAPFFEQMKARVLADTYNESFLSYSQSEPMNYWQSALTPDAINLKPIYLKTDGTLKTDASAVNQAGILGVIIDRDALGVTEMQQEVGSTPYNVRGRYTNIFYNWCERYWNDFTEKGVIFVLD